MHMMPRAAPSTMRGWGAQRVVRLVGVQRAVQNNGNVKSEPKIPGCEESPVVLFTVKLFLVLFLLSWLLR